VLSEEATDVSNDLFSSRFCSNVADRTMTLSAGASRVVPSPVSTLGREAFELSSRALPFLDKLSRYCLYNILDADGLVSGAGGVLLDLMGVASLALVPAGAVFILVNVDGALVSLVCTERLGTAEATSAVATPRDAAVAMA
jgi:hypothetical protein